MLNLRKVGLRYDTPFVCNLRTGFEPLDTLFEGSAVDHPQVRDDQQGSEGCREQQ
jgi:hypothetical protein